MCLTEQYCIYCICVEHFGMANIKLGERVVVLKRGSKACCYGRKEGRHAVHLLLYLQGHCFGNWKVNIQLQRH